jgi:hypothetical protein
VAQGLRAAQRRGVGKDTQDVNLDVFINCPFDAEYKPIFYAAVFTVVRFGFRARCALETDDAAESRLYKIIKIISECKFAVHDISRTELSPGSQLPRFNMPLELGLWLGAHHLGRKDQAGKSCIVFDRDPYRYNQYISDINGQDIHAHGAGVEGLIKQLTAWLRLQPGGGHVAGGQAILQEYRDFERILPALSASQNMTPDELTFGDFNVIVTQYVATLTHTPAKELDLGAVLADPSVAGDDARPADARERVGGRG